MHIIKDTMVHFAATKDYKAPYSYSVAASSNSKFRKIFESNFGKLRYFWSSGEAANDLLGSNWISTETLDNSPSIGANFFVLL